MLPVTVGAAGVARIVVREDNTASAMKSGSLPVFATPALIALAEEASCEAMAPYLEEDETTVGTKVDIAHTAATPIGCTVVATAKIVEVHGREIVFSIVVEDNAGVVAEGTHSRFLVRQERFMEKAQKRLPSASA